MISMLVTISHYRADSSCIGHHINTADDSTFPKVINNDHVVI